MDMAQTTLQELEFLAMPPKQGKDNKSVMEISYKGKAIVNWILCNTN